MSNVLTAGIFEVPVATQGRLYIMPCPRGARDIGDLAVRGIETVISHLEPSEAEALFPVAEKTLCEQVGMSFQSEPITDFSLPELDEFRLVISGLCCDLKAGRQIAVHCRAGIGRSGMTTCAVLIALGASAQEAIERVSTARGIEVPDTQEQRQFIEAL